MAPKTKGAKDQDIEEGAGEEEETGADKDVEGDGGGGDPPGNLESHIREVVSKVVNDLLGDRPTATKSSPAQDEASVFKMVQDAQTKLKKEEEKDKKFSEVAETVESLKKVTERPPARAGVGGKVQAWLWGSDG